MTETTLQAITAESLMVFEKSGTGNWVVGEYLRVLSWSGIEISYFCNPDHLFSGHVDILM